MVGDFSDYEGKPKFRLLTMWLVLPVAQRRARFGSVRQMLQSVPLMTKVLLAWVTVETVLITAYTGVVLATGARQQFVCVLLVR